MRLRDELKLKRDFSSIDHEALLSVVVTSSMLLKVSDRFFAKHGITGTQFNILKMLREFQEEGLNQQELSEKLVVTKSNVVGLIDRLEKSGYVERKKHLSDRRCYRLGLTRKGKRLVEGLEVIYFKKVNQLLQGLTQEEKKELIRALEGVRENIRQDRAG